MGYHKDFRERKLIYRQDEVDAGWVDISTTDKSIIVYLQKLKMNPKPLKPPKTTPNTNSFVKQQTQTHPSTSANTFILTRKTKT